MDVNFDIKARCKTVLIAAAIGWRMIDKTPGSRAAGNTACKIMSITIAMIGRDKLATCGSNYVAHSRINTCFENVSWRKNARVQIVSLCMFIGVSECINFVKFKLFAYATEGSWCSARHSDIKQNFPFTKVLFKSLEKSVALFVT